jgi:hypothetical protein
MNAVEVAYRERAGRARRCVGKTAKYLHKNLGKTSAKWMIIRFVALQRKKALSATGKQRFSG